MNKRAAVGATVFIFMFYTLSAHGVAAHRFDSSRRHYPMIFLVSARLHRREVLLVDSWRSCQCKYLVVYQIEYLDTL